MKLLLVILLTVFIILAAHAEQPGIIEGRVIDKSTKQPLAAVNIILLNTKFGTATDTDGYFIIDDVPQGRYEVRISSIGYETVTNSDVIISEGRKFYMVIELTQSVTSLEKEIVIRGEFYRKDPSLFSSTHTLNAEEIRRHPGGAEDISRVLLSLPGVITSSDDRNDLLVRGGNPTENLNLVDNIEVPNINHFGTQGASGGPIGMINNKFIREVDFSSGGFPVKYGERLSSVLDIKLREGNRDYTQGSFIMNIAGYGAQAEGPLADKGSWMISARKSFLDIIKNLNATSVSVVPNYINYMGKAVYNVNPSNQISFIFLGGIDDIYFSKDEYNLNSFFMDYSIKNTQDQYAAGLNLRTLWSKESYSILTISNNYNHYFTDVVRADDNVIFYKNQSFEREWHFKGEYNYKFGSSSEASVGGGFTIVNFNHGLNYIGDTSFTEQNGTLDTVISDPVNNHSVINTSKSFAYLQFTHWLTDKIKTVAGIRWDNFKYISRSDVFSYRAGLSYYFTPITNLNFFYGVNYQTPPYIWLTSDPSSVYLDNMKAEHFIIGLEHLFSEDIKLTIEAYRKNYSQIPVSRVIPEFIASNGGSDYGAFIIRKLLSDGKGYSQGVEITLQKKLLNNFYGIISYGASKVLFTALDKIERPGSFDFRDVFTFALGYVPNSTFEFSIKWRYAGGRPYTPFDPVLSAMLKKGVEDYSQLNSLRYPPYHRLDIRGDFRFHLVNWNIVTYLDLQNAYFRKNIYEYQWDIRKNEQKEVYQWRFFPVAGINIEF